MNIFVTSPNPFKCAKDLDNVRLNKMLTETVQMLSVYFGAPYKPTHVNHPCTKWVCSDMVNLSWTLFYLVALAMEYKERTGKKHLAYIKFCDAMKDNAKMDEFRASKHFMTTETPKSFCNCSYYKDEQNVFKAYQKTLADKWENDKKEPKFS